MYTPGGDEYVEALAAYSFYAQITRHGRAFAYPAEGDGDVVQFPKVISDDEMARLICVGGGVAEDGSGRDGVPWSQRRPQQLLQFFQEQIACENGASPTNRAGCVGSWVPVPLGTK